MALTKSVTSEDASDLDVWTKLLWVFAVGGSIAMLYYEYTWSRSALGSSAKISLGNWLSTGLAIASPWILSLACVSTLREAARNGRVGRDLYLKISVWVEMVMLSAYWMLSTLTSSSTLR